MNVLLFMAAFVLLAEIIFNREYRHTTLWRLLAVMPLGESSGDSG